MPSYKISISNLLSVKYHRDTTEGQYGPPQSIKSCIPAGKNKIIFRFTLTSSSVTLKQNSRGIRTSEASEFQSGNTQLLVVSLQGGALRIKSPLSVPWL